MTINLNHNKFSMILEINGRLEIGRKFFSSLGSRLGSLRRGKMTALWKAWGNKPELRDEFISAVNEAQKTIKYFQQKWSGDRIERTGFRGRLRDHKFNHCFRDRLKYGQGNTRERISLSR